MMNILFFWLIAALVLLLAELFVPGLFFALSFAFGSGGAALIAALGYDLIPQIGAFAGVSLGALMVLRSIVSHTVACAGLRTNADALVGMQGLVTRAMSGQTEPGLVKLGGQVWVAYEHRFGAVSEGSVVEVVKVTGCHLLVRELHKVKEAL